METPALKMVLLFAGSIWFNISFRQEKIAVNAMLFDAFIFLSENKTVTAYISAGGLILGGLVSFIIAIRLSLQSIRLHRDLSEKTHNGKNSNLINYN